MKDTFTINILEEVYPTGNILEEPHHAAGNSELRIERMVWIPEENIKLFYRGIEFMGDNDPVLRFIYDCLPKKSFRKETFTDGRYWGLHDFNRDHLWYSNVNGYIPFEKSLQLRTFFVSNLLKDKVINHLVNVGSELSEDNFAWQILGGFYEKDYKTNPGKVKFIKRIEDICFTVDVKHFARHTQWKPVKKDY